MEVGRAGAPVVETAERHATTNVEMVADEVCCWAAEQWRLAAAARGYEFYRPTRDV